MLRREDVLFVDGYNMIGAWPELAALKRDNLEDARDRLLDMLADYQSFAGLTIIVVFDAFRVPGLGSTFRQNKLQVVFTRERETADECIERLVGEWSSVRRHLYVATSDMTEQHVTFGRGAMRISARELKLEVDQSRRSIEQSIRPDAVPKRNPLDHVMSEEIHRKLERLRRGIEEKDSPDGE